MFPCFMGFYGLVLEPCFVTLFYCPGFIIFYGSLIISAVEVSQKTKGIRLQPDNIDQSFDSIKDPL